MSNNYIKSILVISFILVLTCFSTLGIVKIINVLGKKNKETIFAEKNEILVANEDVFYVDLTKKSDDYTKIKERTNSVKEENKINSNEDEIQNITTNEKINIINEECFDIEFDFNSRKAIIDGEEHNIEDVIEIPENVQAVDYIKEQIIGDVEVTEKNIKVENPYSTNSILVETSDINSLENIGNIDSIVKIANDTYCFNYKNAKDTKDGYNILRESQLVKNVCKDAKVKILEENNNMNAQYVSENNYVWGANTTGLYKYLSKLNEQDLPIVRVGVLDTGVRTTHEVFQTEKNENRFDLTNSYNYIANNIDIGDDNGHGTMVAGIISESTSNNVKLVPIKTLNSSGEGELSDTLQAIVAICDKVDLMNLSLGISKDKLPINTINVCELVLKQVYEKNKIIICATGNEGKENVYYPAASEYTIAVSATDIDNKIAYFSNYGDTVDFAAPGMRLVLPHYTGDSLYNSSFPLNSVEYSRNSGTSFASPFIASAVALIKSENKNYTISQIKKILQDNSDDLGETGKDKYFGYGLLNFYKDMFKPKIDDDKNTLPNETSNENTIIDEPGDVKILGDVNKSNTVDMGDIIMLLRHIAQDANKAIYAQNPNWKLTEDLIKIGDLNKNNNVDIGDIIKLLRYIAASNSQEVKKEHPDWVEL